LDFAITNKLDTLAIESVIYISQLGGRFESLESKTQAQLAASQDLMVKLCDSRQVSETGANFFAISDLEVAEELIRKSSWKVYSLVSVLDYEKENGVLVFERGIHRQDDYLIVYQGKLNRPELLEYRDYQLKEIKNYCQLLQLLR
jgi:hypothetical protein